MTLLLHLESRQFVCSWIAVCILWRMFCTGIWISCMNFFTVRIYFLAWRLWKPGDPPFMPRKLILNPDAVKSLNPNAKKSGHQIFLNVWPQEKRLLNLSYEKFDSEKRGHQIFSECLTSGKVVVKFFLPFSWSAAASTISIDFRFPLFRSDFKFLASHFTSLT